LNLDITMVSPRLNLRQLIVQTVAMQVAFMLALFLPAGTVAWPTGWLYVAVSFVFGIGLTAWLVRYDPELLAERLTGLRRKDQKKWDKVFVAIIIVGFFSWLAVMGLDAARVRWSHVPMWLQAIGAVLFLISYCGFYLTFRENPARKTRTGPIGTPSTSSPSRPAWNCRNERYPASAENLPPFF
jgi:hypothetical protein